MSAAAMALRAPGGPPGAVRTCVHVAGRDRVARARAAADPERPTRCWSTGLRIPTPSGRQVRLLLLRVRVGGGGPAA